MCDLIVQCFSLYGAGAGAGVLSQSSHSIGVNTIYLCLYYIEHGEHFTLSIWIV